MIWSLLKVVLFVAVIAAVSFGADHLLDTEGGIRIAVAGWEFKLGPLQATVAMLVLLAGAWRVASTRREEQTTLGALSHNQR